MTQPTPDARTWLRSLHGLALAWVESAGPPIATAHTPAYVDLQFAFGFARLGASADAIELMERADGALSVIVDAAHQFLLGFFGYRIRQAMSGAAHGGPLPAAMVESRVSMERLASYVVERLAKHSRILQPDHRINPYRHWGARISDFEKALADLTDLTDPTEIERHVRHLLAAPEQSPERTARVLRAALDAAPRVGEDFAHRLLAQAIPTYDDLPPYGDLRRVQRQGILMERASSLEAGLVVAGCFRQREHLARLIERVRSLFRKHSDAESLIALESAVVRSIQALVDADQPEMLDEFLGEARDLLLGGRPVEPGDLRWEEHGAVRTRVMLRLCRGWFAFGFDALAEPVLQAVWERLLAGGRPAREQSQLASAYLAALGHAPQATARPRLEEVLRQLRGIKDTYTTSSHFAVSQLDVTEAAVLAAVQAHGRGID